VYADAFSSDEGDCHVNDGLRSGGRRALGKLTATNVRTALTRNPELTQLRRRVRKLEDEMQEARRLNRRLAELTDIVQELLVPLSLRDEDKIDEYLQRYSSSL
jgi:hypothetical protein